MLVQQKENQLVERKNKTQTSQNCKIFFHVEHGVLVTGRRVPFNRYKSILYK